jgi:hypothetical protein
MALYETFLYSENLPQRILTQLPDKLKISGDKDPALLLILRLLSGNVELKHNFSNKKVKSRVNYFSSDLSSFNNWKIEFPNLFSEDVKASDISIFINNTKYKNKVFYSGILSELSQFILHEKNRSHTSAFIYIYRILEKISYAFPLIYASKADDFRNSYQNLQLLMGGEKSKDKGELAFFKTFIINLYQGDSIQDTSVDININVSNSDVQKQMFQSLRLILSDSMVHSDSIEFNKLSINFCEMGSFIVTVRNRFFHNKNGGHKNLDSNFIVDSDKLFSFINPMAIHWLAMVFLQITTYSLSEFQSYRQDEDE